MEELKVGQSFDVVEVIDNNYNCAFDQPYKINGFSLLNKDRECLENGIDSTGAWLYFLPSYYKKVAKLTITKLK